jgi:ankyrin repeat protein
VYNQDKDSALTTAAYRGHLEIATMLIEKGANVNQVNKVCSLSWHITFFYLLVLRHAFYLSLFLVEWHSTSSRIRIPER